MAKILMVNLPYSGHVNPTLPLAKELEDKQIKKNILSIQQKIRADIGMEGIVDKIEGYLRRVSGNRMEDNSFCK